MREKILKVTAIASLAALASSAALVVDYELSIATSPAVMPDIFTPTENTWKFSDKEAAFFLREEI